MKSRDENDNREVLIGAEDEGLLGRINEIKSCWCLYPLRPLVRKQLVREYFYVYSFVCPKLGIMISLILPYCDISMMEIFLKEVSKQLSNYFIIIQVDRAVWHTSKKIDIPENIRLVLQPRGSPELNPVEHIWDEIKESYLCNIIFESLDEMKELVCLSLEDLSKDRERIKSMTYFPHFRL